MLDRLDDDDAEHFDDRPRACSTAPAIAYAARRDARPRARLLHAHRVRVQVRRARRPVGARRRRPLRRPGRAARRARDARAAAGRPGSSGSCWRSTRAAAAPQRRRLRRRRRGPARARLRARASSCAARGLRAELDLAGRSIKGQMKQADRIGAAQRGDPRRRRRRAAPRHGERRAARARPRATGAIGGAGR